MDLNNAFNKIYFNIQGLPNIIPIVCTPKNINLNLKIKKYLKLGGLGK